MSKNHVFFILVTFCVFFPVSSNALSEGASLFSGCYVRKRQIKAHSSAVHAISYLKEDSRVISCGDDDISIVWECDTGERVDSYSGRGILNPGGLLTVRHPYGLFIYDVYAARLLYAFSDNSLPILVNTMSSDKRYMVQAINNDIMVQERRQDSFPLALKGHIAPVTTMCIASDNETLISGAQDATICLWDLKNMQGKYCLKGHDASISCLALSVDGTELVSGGEDGNVILWDLNVRERKNTISVSAYIKNKNDKKITSVALLPQGDRIIVLSRFTGLSLYTQQGFLLQRYGRIVNVQEDCCFINEYCSVSLSQDGVWLVTGDTNGVLTLWKTFDSNDYNFSSEQVKMLQELDICRDKRLDDGAYFRKDEYQRLPKEVKELIVSTRVCLMSNSLIN